MITSNSHGSVFAIHNITLGASRDLSIVWLSSSRV